MSRYRFLRRLLRASLAALIALGAAELPLAGEASAASVRKGSVTSATCTGPFDLRYLQYITDAFNADTLAQAITMAEHPNSIIRVFGPLPVPTGCTPTFNAVAIAQGKTVASASSGTDTRVAVDLNLALQTEDCTKVSLTVVLSLGDVVVEEANGIVDLTHSKNCLPPKPPAKTYKVSGTFAASHSCPSPTVVTIKTSAKGFPAKTNIVVVTDRKARVTLRLARHGSVWSVSSKLKDANTAKKATYINFDVRSGSKTVAHGRVLLGAVKCGHGQKPRSASRSARFSGKITI